ncbi:MAG: hypothetical protein AABZ60_16530 [Planctomycetota bacterium]
MSPYLVFLFFGICYAQEFQGSCSGISGGEIYAREGVPCPILISLEQTQGERQILISLSDIQGDNLVVQKKISLVGASKKRFVLHFTPFSLPTQFKVRIQPPDLPPIEQELNIKDIFPAKTPYYLCYSNRPHLFQFFNKSLLPPLVTEEVSLSEWLPLYCQSAKFLLSQAEGYEHAQGIIFEDTQERFLIGTQREALKDWIFRGGHLIYCLTDTPGSESNSFLTELTHWKIGEIQKLEALNDLKFFQNLEPGPVFCRVVSGHRIQDIQLTTQTHPILLSRPIGAGQVTLLALDIGRPPLKEWKDREKLVQQIALLHKPFFLPGEAHFQQFLENSLSKISDAGQVHFLFFYLCLLLVGTGPVTFFGVKRWIKRWYLVLPTILLLLAGMAYLSQLRWKRTPETQVQIDLSYYWEKEGIRRSYFSLFSFERRLLSFSWDLEKNGVPNYWRTISEKDSPPTTSMPSSGILWQDDSPQFQDIPINSWNWCYFQSAQLLQASKAPISYSIRWENDKMTGHLINHTDLRFECLLVIRESPLNQFLTGNHAKYPPWIATLNALEPHAVLAFREIPLSISVSTDWDSTLSQIGASPYSWETHHFFETLPLKRGKTLIVGVSVQEKSSSKHHYSYVFMEGAD